MKDIRQGGCLCGKARYEIDLTNHETGNCHCRDCQKNAGAPFMMFTLVPAVQFRWLKKPLGEFAASALAVRRFCKNCGTPLQWDGVDEPHSANISTATLDDPSGITAAYEIFTASRLDGILAVAGAKQFDAGFDQK